MEQIRLRLAALEDASLVFRWRNDPVIVSRGTSNRTVTWQEHLDWFRQTVTAQDRLMFLVQRGDTPIGQIRFDHKDAQSCILSVYLAPEFIGKGYGVPAIRAGCMEMFKHWKIPEVIANVRTDNTAAKSAFLKAGFQDQSICRQCDNDHFELVYRIPHNIPHNRLTFGVEEAEAVSRVVTGGHWAGGPRLRALEGALMSVTGRQHAVGVASGLSALRLSLLALGVRPSDEVIVPAYSCVALANAALAIGAIPVPVDVSDRDWNIDCRQVEEAISERTGAIIAVHTFGLPAGIRQLKASGIPVIEDCAHALGLNSDGVLLGSQGDAAVCSFYATKLIGSGEGGAVLTDRREVADALVDWRDYGDKAPCAFRLNDKMNDLEAGLACVQLDRLPSMLAHRLEIARRYDRALRPLAERTGAIRLPCPSDQRVWYRYAIEVLDREAQDVIAHMARYAIRVEQPVCSWLSEEQSDHFPVARRAYARLVSLPIYPTLRDEEQALICDALSVLY
jgi:dTDP-4-amino-4,6-dideoxygalactose transaminase/RimJ/RimL family protein N-acetyltransferase